MHPSSFIVSLATLVSCVIATEYQVLVGGPDAVFVPNNITAVENDTVTFTFINGSHSVVESNFVFPCEFINDNEPGVNGFNSGIRPANNGTSITNLTVAVTKEMANHTIWWYDGSDHECGWDETAIGGINLNETSDETLAGYQRNAARLFGSDMQNDTDSPTTTRTHTSQPTATDFDNGAYQLITSKLAIPVALVVVALTATFF